MNTGEAPGLDHVTIAAADLRASTAFYDAALGALGMVRLDELVDEEEDDAAVEAAAWGTADGARRVWVVSSLPATAGLHLSLRTRSAADVEAFFHAAVAAGGRERQAPRRWPIYRRGEFNAMVLDPAGNVVEAVAPE